MLENEFLLKNFLIDLPTNIEKIDDLILFTLNKNKSPFSKLSNDELEKLFFDKEENRIFGDEIRFENKIIDINEINIRNSYKIHFFNCIFNTKIHISDNENKLSVIYFDNCIFGEKVAINKSLDDKLIISICNCNFSELFFNSINNVDVSISYSDIIIFDIYNSKINNFNTFNNEISIFKKNDSKIVNTDFSYSQLKKTKKIINRVNFKLYSKKLEEFLPKFFRRIYYIYNIETIDFLLENTDLKLFRNEYSKIKYKKLLQSPNFLNKTLVLLTGGFYKPFRFIMFSIMFIFIFAIIYSFFEFNIASTVIKKLSFCDCIYFSGVTFYTIGYGDITPLYISKFLVLFEAFCGLIINSSILVSFVKKYIE